MKILFLNPNSSIPVTARIREAVSGLGSDSLSIVVGRCPGSPTEIVTAEDELKAGIQAVETLKKEDFDAAVIGCFADSGLRSARECIIKPVVGLFESSVYFARLKAHRYAIIASGDESEIEPWLGTLRMMGEEQNIHSIECIGAGVEGALHVSDDRILERIRKVRSEGAGAAILGCAAFAGRGRRLSEAVGIPVIDGVEESIRLAEMLVRYGRY